MLALRFRTFPCCLAWCMFAAVAPQLLLQLLMRSLSEVLRAVMLAYVAKHRLRWSFTS